MSETEQKQVQELKRRDQEVRAHEAAHRAAGGALVRGGVAYTYQRGPDGVLYAVGGEVQLDTAEVPGDPAATQRKAETVRRAALAPLEPSPQDLKVAAEATQKAAAARAELGRASRSDGAGSEPEGVSRYRDVAAGSAPEPMFEASA